LDRSDAAVLDGTKLDYYQVPEKTKQAEPQPIVAEPSNTTIVKKKSEKSSSSGSPDSRGRKALPRAAENRAAAAAERDISPVRVPAVAVAADQTENTMKIKAQIQQEKARRAKLQVLDEWLFNADLGHLRQQYV
jgi:hypothetical protein